MTRKITLFIFSVFFAIETLINAGVELSVFQWVMLGLSASMAGRASAYLVILEWFRWPFVKLVPHSSGAGEDYEPKWETGPLSAIGDLICCPVCSGTWAGVIILTIYKFFPSWGMAIMILLSVASLAWLNTEITRYFEWNTHMARERTGQLNRQNKVERGEYHKAWNELYKKVMVLEDSNNRVGHDMTASPDYREICLHKALTAQYILDQMDDLKKWVE